MTEKRLYSYDEIQYFFEDVEQAVENTLLCVENYKLSVLEAALGRKLTEEEMKNRGDLKLLNLKGASLDDYNRMYYLRKALENFLEGVKND